MLSDELAFNLKLTQHLALYRYPLWDEDGDGIDMTWCVFIDDDAIERRGDNSDERAARSKPPKPRCKRAASKLAAAREDCSRASTYLP